MDMNDGPQNSFRGRNTRGGGRGFYSRGGGGGGGGGGGFYQRDASNGGNNTAGGGFIRGDGGGGRAGGYQGGRGYQGGAGGGGYQQGGYQGGYQGGNQGGDTGGRRGRGGWGNDRGFGRGRARGRGGRGRPRFEDPEDIQFVKALKGHEKLVTALIIDEANNQLYTGSQDHTVRVWSFESGECTAVVKVGAEVDSMLLEGSFLFVGMHKLKEGLVKVWNTVTGAEHSLPGHQGQVLALASAGEFLFSGGQDGTIAVWKFDSATETFVSAAALSAAQGGHTTAVQTMITITQPHQFLVSGDWDGNMKVWDLASGTCTQTIQGAHSSLLMQLLSWEGHVISCSLDSTIKVWQLAETPAPGAVLDAQPIYVHPPEQPASAGARAQPAGGEYGGILAIAGTMDPSQKPVLMASHLVDDIIRLWELPTFAERGELSAARDARALGAASAAGLLVSGDKFGVVKVWKWKPPVMAT